MILYREKPYWFFVDIPFTGSDYVYQAVKQNMPWPTVIDLNHRYSFVEKFGWMPPQWKLKSVVMVRNPYSRAVALWEDSKKDKKAREDTRKGFQRWLEIAADRKFKTKVPWPRERNRLSCRQQACWLTSTEKVWTYTLSYEHLEYDFNCFLADLELPAMPIKVQEDYKSTEWKSLYNKRCETLVKYLWPQDTEIFYSQYFPPSVEARE